MGKRKEKQESSDALPMPEETEAVSDPSPETASTERSAEEPKAEPSWKARVEKHQKKFADKFRVVAKQSKLGQRITLACGNKNFVTRRELIRAGRNAEALCKAGILEPVKE